MEKPKHNYQITVTKLVQEDHYEKGCSLDSIYHGTIATYRDQPLSELPNIVEFYTGCTINDSNPRIFNDCIEVSVTENAYGHQPTQEENERFKLGEIKLYVADYSFQIAKVEKLGYNDLVKAFGPGTEYDMEDEGY